MDFMNMILHLHVKSVISLAWPVALDRLIVKSVRMCQESYIFISIINVFKFARQVIMEIKQQINVLYAILDVALVMAVQMIPVILVKKMMQMSIIF